MSCIKIGKGTLFRIIEANLHLLVKSAERVCRRGVHLGGLVGQSGDQPGVVLQLDGPGDRHFLVCFVENFRATMNCELMIDGL